jgi:hypothetical protein
VRDVRVASPDEIAAGSVTDAGAALLQVLPPKDRSQLH